jgi:outer membrane protein TolC
MRFAIAILIAGSISAETHKLDLPAALRRAAEQAPDILLSRFDEINAQQAVNIARDPFLPKVVVGSGLAYTYGFPMSIEGSAPSIFQAKAIQSLVNRPQSYLVAKAKVEARGANLMVQQRRDEVLDRTARLFLDADRTARNLVVVNSQIQNLEQILDTSKARVEEGKALPLDARRAEINVQRARQRRRILESEQSQLQHSLAFVLGYESEDQVAPMVENTYDIPTPPDAATAVREALENSRELRKLQSDMQAKNLEIQANKASWLPQVDLVAQYGLFSRFNNLDDYFNRFQRNNALAGVSFKFPVIPGTAVKAQTVRAANEVNRLRLQVTNTRNRIELDARKLFEDLALHRDSRDLARQDLDLAHEQINVLLLQAEEGKASRRQVEEARFIEGEKWIAYWDAQHMFDRARVALVYATGSIHTLAAK